MVVTVITLSDKFSDLSQSFLTIAKLLDSCRSPASQNSVPNVLTPLDFESGQWPLTSSMIRPQKPQDCWSRVRLPRIQPPLSANPLGRSSHCSLYGDNSSESHFTHIADGSAMTG